MRCTRALLLSFCLVATLPAFASGNGMLTLRSHHSVSGTINRLEHALRAKGMTIFARVNHAKGAKGVGLKLRPTELLIFGNPKVGTLLMQCNQEVGLDLPLKALAWQGPKGQVWLSYNKPQYIVKRDHLGHCAAGAVAMMRKAEHAFAEAATR